MAGFKNIVVQTGAAAAGFIASVINAGVQFANRFTLTAAEHNVAAAVSADRHSVRIDQLPAASSSLLGAVGETSATNNTAVASSPSASSLSSDSVQQNTAASLAQSLRSHSGTTQVPSISTALLAATGDAAKPQASPAFSTSARISQYNQNQTPAGNIIQVVYSLSRLVGGNSVTETAVGGRTDWASDAECLGLAGGASATFAGNLLAARGGQLELSYANAVNKSDLTIVSAHLRFYGSVSGTVLNNADVQLKYDVGAGFVTLQTITGDLDFGGGGSELVFDISSVLDTWTKHDALRTAVSASSAVAETWTANLNAVELLLTATKTDTP